MCDVYQLPSPALYLLHPHPGDSLKTHYQVGGEQDRGQGHLVPQHGLGNIHIQAHGSLSLLDMAFSGTSLRHEYVMISSRRKGGRGDLSLFQLSLLGKEGGGKLKYTQCHPFYRFLYGGHPYL